MSFFHDHLVTGDYLVIEDGNLSDIYPERYPDHSSGPHVAIRQFLAAHPGEYQIDAGLCDFFGYNVTTCSNSILRRILWGPAHDRSGSPRRSAAVVISARVAAEGGALVRDRGLAVLGL